MQCPSCSAAMLPGAAFCRACGEAFATATAPGASPTPAAPALGPAAMRGVFSRPWISIVALAAVPAAIAIWLISIRVKDEVPFDSDDLAGILIPAAIAAPLVWGLLMGMTWARWASLLAGCALIGMMAVAIANNVRSLNDPYTQSVPGLRARYAYDAFFYSVEAAIGAVIVAGLIRVKPRS